MPADNEESAAAMSVQGPLRDDNTDDLYFMAFLALRDSADQPLERVGKLAADIAKRIRLVLSPEEAEPVGFVLNDCRRFAIMMAELFGEIERQQNARGETFEPSLRYKARLVRRTAGKPVNVRERENLGFTAVGIVERLREEGWQVEAAIAKASAETGLSRSEIQKWRSHPLNRG